ncbi:MAG: TetR/AcrR family transcriptional regulator [Anaerolineae bacterium]
MARYKEFDEGKVLDKAMRLFWKKGYTSTSIQDLEDHLGIGRRSLYNTFNNKRDLYLAALSHYQQGGGGMFPKDEPDCARNAIKEIFIDVVETAVADETRCGCFMVNTAIELAPHDEKIAAISARSAKGIAAGFKELVEWGQSQERIPAEKNSTALSHFLANSYFGLHTMAKMNPDRASLLNAVNMTLAILD